MVAIFMFTLLLSAQGVPILSAREEPGWQRTVEAAKKEGHLNVYLNRAQTPVLNAGVFQKKYPEIKVVQVIGQRSLNVHRILAERRAKKYLAEVHIGGVTTNLALYQAKALDPIKPALTSPEVVNESKWWLGRHHYGDPEQKYIFKYIGAPRTAATISYNVNLVNPKDFKSLRDLLNPKWKGKIVALDVRAGGPPGATMRFIYYYPKLGPKFIKQFFGNMEATLTRNRLQAVDWIAAGKFSICFLCSRSDVRRAKRQGLPVDSFDIREEAAGIASQAGSLSLLNKAPHPNAARVFINWLLSREGQLTLQRAIAESGGVAPDSLRIDIPKDDVPPMNRRVEGTEYLDLETPSRLDMTPIFKALEEALRGAQKR